jgi:hypothetical protein
VDDVSWLPLLAERLRLGVPLQGFDGDDIPLHYGSGTDVGLIEAAILLLLSATSALQDEYADQFVAATIAEVDAVEREAVASGMDQASIVETVVAILVRAALRADLVGAGHDVDAPTIENAARSWYSLNSIRRQILVAGQSTSGGRLLA